MDGLTHYTRSLQAVPGILSNGFAWVPNRRNLMSQLVPNHDFSTREPQEFGMISFTDWSPPAPVGHRAKFGDFGIVVSHKWAREQRAQRVIYLPEEGPVSDALRWLYTTAHDHLISNIEHPDDACAQMASTNKAMAGVTGELLWANLLTLYEYLEPMKNASQSEWRIVQGVPLYGYACSTAKIIEAVSPPEGWGKHTKVLRAPAEAINGFVCPDKAERSFRQALPPQFSGIPIVLYEG